MKCIFEPIDSFDFTIFYQDIMLSLIFNGKAVMSSFGVRVNFFVIQMLDGVGLGMINMILLKLEKTTDGFFAAKKLPSGND